MAISDTQIGIAPPISIYGFIWYSSNGTVAPFYGPEEPIDFADLIVAKLWLRYQEIGKT
jgi:hypothetical protein